MPDLAVSKTMKLSELDALLKKNGWTLLRVTGSHRMYTKNGRNERVALGDSQEIGGGGLKEIIRRFGLPYFIGDESDSVKGTKSEPKRQIGKESEVRAKPGTFGYRLWEARTKAGMSQGGLAKAAGAHQVMISSWERGESDPLLRKYKTSGPAIWRIAEMFGFRDIQEQFEEFAPTTKAVEEKKEPEPPAQLPETTESTASLPVKVDSDIKLLLNSLKASDIMQWILNRENRIKELEAYVAKYERSDYRVLQRKAIAYDAIVQDAEALIARAKKEME